MNKRRIFKSDSSGIRCYLKNSGRPKRSYEEKIRSKSQGSKSKEPVPDEWDDWFPWES